MTESAPLIPSAHSELIKLVARVAGAVKVPAEPKLATMRYQFSRPCG